MNTKGKALIWILIILIILAIIIGLVILFTGSDGGISNILPGNSIPKPPALPN